MDFLRIVPEERLACNHFFETDHVKVVKYVFGKEHLRQRPVYIFCLFCHAAKVHKKHLPDSYDIWLALPTDIFRCPIWGKGESECV